MALLEADVALPVVKDFVNKVKERAVGTEVSKSLTPGQAFVKIVRAELEELMGAANEDLALSVSAAGGDPDGRPAGRGQDHHRGQAGALP